YKYLLSKDRSQLIHKIILQHARYTLFPYTTLFRSLTQYKPLLLNTHIGIGTAWDYDRNEGGLRVLPPFTSEDGGRWYTGTDVKGDRKSTRLNSSHVSISYAVFCLKKKKEQRKFCVR